MRNHHPTEKGFSSHTTDEAPALRVTVHPTEAQAGARSGVLLAGMGIPEGGRCTPTTAGEAEGILPLASQQAVQRRAGVLPGVYRTVRSACRCIREATARQPKDVHYLRLTDREFLTVYHAIEHDRSRTHKAIRKGIADPQDLKASDSVWQALQGAMTQRLRKAWMLP